MHKVLIIALCSFCLAAASIYGQIGVIANDKMNVFYVGVDNPISVAVAGVPSQNLVLEGSGGGISIRPSSEGKYIVYVTQAGEAILTVKDSKTAKVYATLRYRCKRIPDPVVRLNGKQGGNFGAGEMKAQLGLVPEAPNFDMDIKLDVQSYTLYYNSRGETTVLQGKGSRFTAEIANAVSKASPGDTYTFTDIRVRCPGDNTARAIDNIAIKIR
jgi:hypothetical protein